MHKLAKMLGALLLISGFAAGARLWAWDAELMTRWDFNSVAVASGLSGSAPMQSNNTRFRLEGVVGNREEILAGWNWDMSYWGELDGLPSENPLELPAAKLAGSGRFLELTSSWEVWPGVLVLDAGKKVSHTSAGFFKTPLNLLQRPPLFSETAAKAVGIYEEGWVGAGVTYFNQDFTVANYFSPRLAWNAETQKALAYLTAPQEQWQDQVQVSWRTQATDIKLVVLAATSAEREFRARYGLGFESQAGEGVTLRAEGVVSDQLDRMKAAPPAEAGGMETLAWVPQALAGLTYTSPEQLTVMAEYYFNGLGFWDDRPAAAPDLLNQNGYFETSRHYGFARIAKSIDHQTTGEAWCVLNLYDGSGAGGLAMKRAWDAWSVLAGWMTFFGGEDTEGGCSPFLQQLALEIKLYI